VLLALYKHPSQMKSPLAKKIIGILIYKSEFLMWQYFGEFYKLV